MRRQLLLFGLVLSLSLMAGAQDFDVTQHIADTKTFIFDNNQNTVKGFILLELEKKTTCCGSDRIYLEVKIDPSGYVLHAKPLTGKNECFKSSAVDIIKNVKWDAAEFKGPKSIYFEIKPEIECEAQDNQYKLLEVYNNEKLDKEGNLLIGGGEPAVASQETKKEEPAPAPQTNTSQPATQPTTSQPVVTTTPTRSDEPSTQPTTQPASETSNFVEPETEDQLAQAKAEQEAATEQREAKQQEIVELRAQLSKLREEEAARQRKEAERRKAEEERRRAQEEAVAARNQAQQDDWGSGSADLFAEDAYGTGAEGDGFAAAGETEEDRMQAQIDQLRLQIEELLASNQQREEEMRVRLQEQQETNQQILEIERQLVEAEEQKAQYKEQQELAQIEEDRLRIEEDRRREEEQYQQMMDEIKRLQEEADAKIQVLEAKKSELDNMANVKRLREQEIALARALREKENEKRVEDTRLSLLSSGNTVVALSDDSYDPNNLSELIPDLVTEVDSEKLQILISEITRMQIEIQRLQEQIRASGGTPATNTNFNRPSSQVVSTRSSNNKSTKSTNPTRGDQDKSWEGIDYKAPGVDPEEYQIVPKKVSNSTNPAGNDNMPGFDPDQGFSPSPDHKATHINTEGPQFKTRDYINGNEAMKDLIRQDLKAANICGLAQAVFSVTLNPSGDVVRHEVLASSSPAIQTQLNGVIPGMKFQKIDARYNQTIYLEFKSEIVCE